MSALALALQEALPRLIGGGSGDPALQELIAALAEALERGQLELDLQGPPPDAVLAEGWPQRHLCALEGSPLVVRAEQLALRPEAPLVWDGNRLRWRRWHSQLQAVIEQLLERARQPAPQAASAAQQAAAQQQAAAAGLDGDQQRAVLALLQHRLVLLGGGPGTGKTSTVVQMLRAALELEPQLRLHLAAPTGKAATRLGQALPGVPASTLHRLLESQGERWGRHRHRPLALDLLVVDEVSMVDLPLMQALLDALPSQCRLLLVGDPAQLPPVGPGAVLLELSRPERLQALGPAAIQLQTTYRNNGAIAAMAAGLRQQGEAELWRDLETLQPSDNLRWLRCPPQRPPAPALERLRQHQQRLQQLAQAIHWPATTPPDAEALLQELESCILLTPLRQGRWGVEALHQALLGDSSGRGPQHWPVGTPVLNQRNLAEQGLANGDIGVLVERRGERLVLFPGPRLLHPARLADAQPALALTVHKAQGSQYAEVWLLAPSLRRWDARLLYTGLTRARQQAVLVSPDPTVVAPAAPG